MPRVKKIQQRHTQGEIDPRMLSRSDIEQYSGAAETMTNVFPLVQGGYKRRPGLEFIDEIAPVLTRNTGQTITAPNGGTTANANDGSSATVLLTTTNVSTTDPYVVVHYDLGSSKEILFIDVLEFFLTSGSSTQFYIQCSNDNSTWTSIGDAVPATTTSTRHRRRVNASYRYVRLARIGTTDLGTAKVSLSEFWVLLPSATLSDVRLANFTFNTDQHYLMVLTDRNVAIYKDGVLQYDLALYEHHSADMNSLSWAQSADTLIVFSPTIRPVKIKRNGADDYWVREYVTFDYTPQYDFTPAESSPAATLTPSAVSGNITLTASAGVFTSGAVNQYISGNAGRARIIEYVSTTVVKAVTEIPFFDTSAIASGSWFYESGYEDAWSDTRGWPACGTFHEGRLWVGGSTDRPSTLWGSRVGLFFDFDPGSLRDDDAIEGTLDTNQFNRIYNIYSGRGLIIFTAGGEHAVLQQLNEPITPTNFNAKRQTSVGSYQNLPVVEVEGGILYVQRQGSSIQELVYADTQQAFISNIVSLISGHLVGTPVDFALRKSNSTQDANYLLMVNTDGTLTVGCIQRSQLITAFARQTTDGTFLRCGVDEEDMYFAVERSINGVTVRYLERFNDNHTTDCSKRSSSGVPASSFTGFDHLEGEDVKIVVDGDSVINGTIASGTATVGDYITAVNYGVPIIAAGATSGVLAFSAVTTSRAMVLYNGISTTNTGSTLRETLTRLELTSSTLLTAYRGTSSASHAVNASAMVIDWGSIAVESVQHGTITIGSGSTSGTGTITGVDLTRSAVIYLGVTTTSTTATLATLLPRVTLTNTTTVTATRNTSSTAVLTVGYCVVQFKSSVIKSVQQISSSNAWAANETEKIITINSVNPKKCLLLQGGFSVSSSTYSNVLNQPNIIGVTQILLNRVGTGSATVVNNMTVVEFKADVVESIQRIITRLNGESSVDEEISTVDTAKVILNKTGQTTSESSGPDKSLSYVGLLNSTTARNVRGTADNDEQTQSYEIMEIVDNPSTATEYVEVGLNYIPVVVDLPAEEDRLGTVHGNKKNVSEINLQLYQTKNITVNGRRVTFDGYKEAEDNSATTGFTGIKRVKGVRGWDLTGQVTISQDQPLPMTVLALSKRVNV